jgi:NAD(P)-dependent dehydrogenase (short-subunit alcohol dehydrogenase family)
MSSRGGSGAGSGRVALVTGAAVRVGRAIALELARAGADVAVHYRSSAPEAEKTASEIRALGRRAAALAADLSRPDECRDLVRAAASALGGLDVLVHSAASFARAALEDTDESVWGAALDLNARAGFLLAREAAGLLRARRGRVVLVSDALARQPVRGYLAHSVSKAAVEGLVRALALELAPEVSVNGISPGTVLVPEGTTADQAARWAKRVPMQRLGAPEDVARTAAFLCFGPAYVTGQIVGVDGGQSLV